MLCAPTVTKVHIVRFRTIPTADQGKRVPTERIVYHLSVYRTLSKTALLNFQAVLSGPCIALHEVTWVSFRLFPQTAIQIRRGQKAGVLVFTCTGASIPSFSLLKRH
jgi:hypothetical protein